MKSVSCGRHLRALALYGILFSLATALGSMGYYHFGDPQRTCASCHEMGSSHANWSASAHSTLHCRNCHGGSLTLDLHALRAHVNRFVQHFTADEGRPIRLSETDVLRVHVSCRDCHPRSFADWQRSRHAATYGRIFLHDEHNKAEQPASDCLRCHGMFFEGDIEDLIAPANKKNSWVLRDPAKADQPSVPCLACHKIHLPAGDVQSLQFYDQRERIHFPADRLPVLSAWQGARRVRISSDPTQRLCTQCHAPSAAAGHQIGTSDDRTPVGVHEGLSCADCHRSHLVSAKQSCGACHPAQSHCGLAVELMDTTYRNPASKHDIHRVACEDCHTKGRPAASSKPIVLTTGEGQDRRRQSKLPGTQKGKPNSP